MPDRYRLLGHDLKEALATATDAAERLRRSSANGDSADDAFVELRRALADAEHVADALLSTRVRLGEIEPSTVVVNKYLSALEPTLRQRLLPRTALRMRLSPEAGAVVAERDELGAIVRRLVHEAERAMPSGGELTIDTSSIDCIVGQWPSDQFWPRRQVRLTIGDTGHGDRLETWQRVLVPSVGLGPESRDAIAAAVTRRDGCILLESAQGEGSRVHVCLPASADVHTV